MKQMFRYISVLMMLFVGTIASAQSTIKVMPVTNGTVTVDKNSASWGDEVTITVTPDEGYYFQKENLEVVKTVNPNFSLTRGEIPLSRNLTVGGDDPYDLSLARIYSLSIFDDGYEIQISATFTSRISITDLLQLSSSSLIYNGSDQRPSIISSIYSQQLIEGRDYVVTYAESSSKDIGTYSVSVEGIGKYIGNVTMTYTIIAPYGDLTPPNAINNLVYIYGTSQDLITSGSSTRGRMLYSLDGSNYGTLIPQGIEAKEYTIYYKVVSYNDFNEILLSPVSFNVTILPKTVICPTITLSQTNYTYDGNAWEPHVTIKDGDVIIPTSEFNVSYKDNTEVGTATVTISDKDGGNYIVSGSATFTISAADGSLTPPVGKTNLVYTGAAQDLIEAGSSTTGTMQYSLDGTNYSTEIPQGTDAKEYTVYYKVVANAGYSNVDPSSFEVTISPKTVSSPTITLSETSFVYDGNAKEPTATVKDGETTIPASEYTVSYKDNTEVGTATVTITDKDGGNHTVSGSVAFSITAPETPSVVNTDESVTVDGQELYEPSEEVSEAIKEAIETDIALPQKAEGRVEVTDDGGLKFSKGEDLLMALLDMKLKDIVKFVFTGRLFGDSSKLRLKNASTRGTRAAGDMELISEAEYEVIEAGDQMVTVKLEEGEATVETIAITESEKTPITIGKSGKASYCGDKSLDFSFSDEVKAYIATGFDKYEGTIWLTRVKDVPAGVPVLIKGEANKTYDVPVTDSQNSYYTNMFVGNTSGEKIQIQETDGDRVNYYLSGDGTFKSVNKTANIGNNKCYLQLPKTFETAVTGKTQKVKVGSIGKASFAAPVDLDFTNVDGLKAFTATGYDKSTKTIWLTRVMKVQKGEGVLLKGDAKEYEIPSVGVQSSYMNMFVGNTSGDKIQVQEKSEDGSQTNFYLKGDGTFVSVNGYVNIGNNKCYLELPTSMVAVASTRGVDNYILEEAEIIKLPISFRSLRNDGDGTTGINVQSSMFNVPSDAYYTLQGQRVVKPSKGLYIKNGKKVVIK